ncbi:MAG: metallophosphoesterase [Sphingobacterium sp.]|jgi:3',5'-cyclic AMP phosphodiesterase CpdA|nr:metallophosphoesterase [Sphingobacterium sp.]
MRYKVVKRIKMWRQACLFTACLTLGMFCRAQHKSPILRIGIMADIQYANKEDHGSRFYRNSLIKVDRAVEYFNQKKVDFSLILGDLVDEGPKDLPILKKHLSALKAPLYCLLGNHDYVNAAVPSQLHELYGMSNSYYSVVRQNWRFIFLNTNDLSEYATEKGSEKHLRWKNMRDSLNLAGRSNTQPWNGGIGNKQLAWLRAELELSELEKENVLVFTHHPLLPENGYEALNNQAILDILTSFPSVKMVLSGHNHAGNNVLSKNIPFITLEGMIETANDNAFGILEIDQDEINIHGSGRLNSSTFHF